MNKFRTNPSNKLGILQRPPLHKSNSMVGIDDASALIPKRPVLVRDNSVKQLVEEYETKNIIVSSNPDDKKEDSEKPQSVKLISKPSHGNKFLDNLKKYTK